MLAWGFLQCLTLFVHQMHPKKNSIHHYQPTGRLNRNVEAPCVLVICGTALVEHLRDGFGTNELAFTWEVVSHFCFLNQVCRAKIPCCNEESPAATKSYRKWENDLQLHLLPNTECTQMMWMCIIQCQFDSSCQHHFQYQSLPSGSITSRMGK